MKRFFEKVTGNETDAVIKCKYEGIKTIFEKNIFIGRKCYKKEINTTNAYHCHSKHDLQNAYFNLSNLLTPNFSFDLKKFEIEIAGKVHGAKVNNNFSTLSALYFFLETHKIFSPKDHDKNKPGIITPDGVRISL